MKKEKEVKEKKPIYKKWWFWVIIVVIIIAAIGGGGSNEDTSSDSKNTIESQTQENSESQATNDVEDASNVEENTNEVTTEEEPSTPQAQIEKTIRQRIGDEYTYTDIDSITINENLGTEDVEDDYIALVNVTWTQKNSGSTSKEVLSMYSEDLAAYIGQECPNVQEIAIF